MIETNAMFQTTLIRIPRFGISWVSAYLTTFVSDFDIRVSIIE